MKVVQEVSVYLSFRDSNHFKDILNLIRCLESEATIEFTEHSLKIRCMDPSHVSLLNMELPDSMFTQFYATPSKICLNVEDLLKTVFKKTYKDESVTMHCTALTTEFVLSTDVDRKKTVKNLEAIGEDVPVPNLRPEASVRLLLDPLKTKVIEDFSSTHIILTANSDEVVFSAPAEDDVAEEVRLPRGHSTLLSLDCNGTNRATYSLTDLIPLFKAFKPLTEVVTLSFSTDMPLKIDLEVPEGLIHFYLAPMIGV